MLFIIWQWKDFIIKYTNMHTNTVIYQTTKYLLLEWKHFLYWLILIFYINLFVFFYIKSESIYKNYLSW